MKKILSIVLIMICFFVQNSFGQSLTDTVSAIVTDFGGFWASSATSNNPTKPNNNHNLLAFTYGGVTYSTGANNSVLDNHGVSYTSGNWRALPVIFSGNVSTSNGSLFLTVGSNLDGNPSVALTNSAAVQALTIQSSLTDGINGLNIGTGYANLASGTTASFKIYNIVSSKINDAEPDLIITQIASPSGTQDTFRFYDANNNQVGTDFFVNMAQRGIQGTWNADRFKVQLGVPFALSKAITTTTSPTTKPIILVALKLSDLGITTSNYTQVKYLRMFPSGTTDVAFVAYNANGINVPPAIVIDSTATSSVICTTGGAAKLVVQALPATGGSLSYVWQESTNSGSTWNTISDGGVYSGATTDALQISSATVGYQYQCIVTESTSNLSNTSDPFTITAVAGSALGGTLNPTGISACLNAVVSPNYMSVAPTGGTGTYSYQWSSSTSSGGTYTNISGANYANYYPNLSTAGTLYYKVLVTSGCYFNLSTAATVAMTGDVITSVTNGSACSSGGTATLYATASGGTLYWYSAVTGGASLHTGSPYTPTITTTKTYYVMDSIAGGCFSARSPVTATLATSISLNSTNFNITYATSVCAGGSSLVTVSSSVLPDGAYTVDYTITGANTVSQTGIAMTMANGVGTFSTAALSNAGSNTITITLVNMNGCTLTPASGNTYNITVNAGSPNTSNLSVSATNSCTNANSVVTVTSSTLADGTYIVYYNVSGSNTVSSTSAQLTIASGSGSFNLPFLSNAGTNNIITLTSVALSSSPSCSSTVNVASSAFTNNIQALVNAGTPKSICATDASVIIASDASASNYSALTWSTSNGTGSFTNNTTANALSTTAYLPSAADVTAGSRLITLTATGNTGCADAAQTFTLTIKNTYTWIGTNSTDFGTASNWVLGCVPPDWANIDFASNPVNICKLDQDRKLTNITIATVPNNTLDLNGHQLSVAGTLVFSTGSKIEAENAVSTIEYKGTSAQTIPANTFINNTVANLAINNPTTVTMLGNIDLTRSLNLVAGTLATGGLLTIKSNAVTTGVVLPVTGAISGNVIVERYVPARRCFRFMSAPVTTTTTMYQNWQENGNNAPNWGTHITGATSFINGFDSTLSGLPSCFPFNNSTQTWSSISNTNATTLNAGDAYRLMIRGDRTVDLSTNTPPPTNTTIRTTGTLFTGSKTFNNLSQVADGFSFIGNPYQSTVDMNAVLAAGTNVNPNYYYVWDPTLATRGAYVTQDVVNNMNVVGSTASKFIQPAQSFFIKTIANGPASITFTEANKGVNADITYDWKTTTNDQLKIVLFQADSLLNAAPPADGLLIRFDNSFNNAVDQNDALKPGNMDENLGIVNGNNILSIEQRTEPIAGDTINLKTTQFGTTNYVLRTTLSLLPTGVSAFLLDRQLQTTSVINQGAITDYSFSVTGTIMPNRFAIVFNNASPLSINKIQLNSNLNNNQVNLDFTNSSEQGVSKYEIEKSSNGANYSSIGTQLPYANNSTTTNYQSKDEVPFEGQNYYRINMINTNGSNVYSNVSRIYIGVDNKIYFYPNPVKDGKLTIYTGNQFYGEWEFSLIDQSGKLVFSRNIDVNTTTITIPIPATISKGSYIINCKYNNQTTSQKLVIE